MLRAPATRIVSPTVAREDRGRARSSRDSSSHEGSQPSKIAKKTEMD